MTYDPEALEAMLPPTPTPPAREVAPDPDEPPVRLTGRALERWRGELVEQREDGTRDRSDSLFHIGLALAAAGATRRTIEIALAERDVTLGWKKYTDRADADDRYAEVAD